MWQFVQQAGFHRKEPALMSSSSTAAIRFVLHSGLGQAERSTHGELCSCITMEFSLRPGCHFLALSVLPYRTLNTWSSTMEGFLRTPPNIKDAGNFTICGMIVQLLEDLLSSPMVNEVVWSRRSIILETILHNITAFSLWLVGCMTWLRNYRAVSCNSAMWISLCYHCLEEVNIF